MFNRMFSSDPNESTVTTDDFKSLLYVSYKLAMDHYPDGPQTDFMVRIV